MENILPRREARENAFLLAFSQTFGDVPLAEALTNHAENDEEHPVDGFSKLLLNAYYDHSAEVDDEIRVHLRNWTMERLPRVSLTVLRLAIAEMLFGGENKPGVAINEAVELTKKYGADEDYQFVNGLLGAVARDHGLNEEAAVEPAGHTGLLVPVWDFFGSRKIDSEYDGETYSDTTDWPTWSFLTINAVDGSIIDRSLGY